MTTSPPAARRGQAGGRAVVAKYGRRHMQDLAYRWHQIYQLQPIGGNDFAIVNRATGKPLTKTLNGHSYSPNHK